MTAAAAVKQHDITIERADVAAPILYVSAKEVVGIRAGTVIRIGGTAYGFDVDTPLGLAGGLVSGHDYGVGIHEDGKPFATVLAPANPLAIGFVAGFHFAPSGCAEGTEGGDGIPSINPYSAWDLAFRPTCPDPRGMTLVEVGHGRLFWEDIYLLAADHLQGTSRFDATIADGRDLPERIDCKGRYARLDHAAAAEICAHHGKRLIGAEEAFAGAYGVKERCSRSTDPVKTGSMADGGARFVSRRGVIDATGTMWQRGTDGHPDDPRASIFGGSWIDGSHAGSRCANLGSWAGNSHVNLGVRAACDHMGPA